jgi:predicted RND superfamily exporter protein
VAKIALSDPQIAGRLVKLDGTAGVVAVTFSLPEDNADAVGQAASAAEDLAETMRSQYPDLEVDVTGIVMLDRQFTLAAEHDLTVIYPIMGLFLFAVMAIILRSGWAAAVAGVIVLLSSAAGMGLAGWAGIKLTSPAAAASVLILIVAVADSIHLLITTGAQIRKGASKYEAILESLRINAGPVFLTSITTVIGFLSLNWSDAPPFRHFGNIAAAGTAIAWALSMVLLPALMSFLNERQLARGMEGKAATAAVARYVTHNGRIILTITGLALLISVLAVSGLKINDSFVRYFSTNTEFRQNADRVQAALPGLLTIDFSVDSGEQGGIADPDYLKRLQDFTDWLEAQPEVGHVNSLVDVMRRLNRNMHGDDPSYDRLPDSRELAAQYLLLYEFSLPYGLDLNTQIDVDKAASRVTTALHDVSTAEIKSLKERSEGWLAINFPSAARTEGTGVSVIFSYLTSRNIESMLKGTAVAFVLISLCLMVALKSVRLGLLSLGINILPVIFGFGLWAVLFGEIGIYASFVAAAAMGLIVDFTVHILSKYLRARRELGASPREALNKAYAMTGVALWASTTILLVGFSALMLSNFVPNAKFGVMTAIVIAGALVVDFLVLPQMMLWLDREKKGKAHVTQAAE